VVPACIGARRCRGVYAEWNSEARRTPLTISTIVVKLRSDSPIMRVRRASAHLFKKIGSGRREEINDLSRLHNLKAVDDLAGNWSDALISCGDPVSLYLLSIMLILRNEGVPLMRRRSRLGNRFERTVPFAGNFSSQEAVAATRLLTASKRPTS
jgi:hypothetical protein